MTAIEVRAEFARRGKHRSDSSDRLIDHEDEDPWDHQRRSTDDWVASATDDEDDDEELSPLPGDSTFFDIVEAEDSLEDGDLPALTKSGVGGRVVNGRRTTARPIQSPSLAGLVSPSSVAENSLPSNNPRMQQQHRQFWAQLEDDDDDEDPAMAEREQRSYHQNQTGVSMNESDDGPDDEMNDRRSNWLDTSPRRRDETEEYYDNLQTSSTDPDTDFCAAAFTAIGSMCGAGFAVAPASAARSKSKSFIQDSSNRTRRPIMAEKQEEHTAIEVEFVDPTPAQTNTMKKSALLAAMQRKAKEETSRRKEERNVSASTFEDEDVPPLNDSGFDDEEDDEEGDEEPAQFEVSSKAAAGSDLYNGFSTSDKRKFVKLLNSGVSPADASARVILDRNKDATNKNKPSNKVMAKLAFWKKTIALQQQQQEASTRSIKPVLQNAEPANAELEEEEVMQPGQQKDGRAEDEREEAEDEEDVMALAQSSTDPFDEIELVESEVKSPDYAEEKKIDFTPPRLVTPAPVVAETAMSTPASNASSEGRPFAKSGIDYYDGVRPQPEHENDDDTEAQMLASNLSGVRKQGALRAPRSFVKLAERSKSAPRTRLGDEDEDDSIDKQISVHSQALKDAESFSAGILAKSEAQRQRDMPIVLPQSQDNYARKLDGRQSRIDKDLYPKKDRNPARFVSTDIPLSPRAQSVSLPLVSPDVSQSVQKSFSERGDYAISPVSTASFDGLHRINSADHTRPEPVILSASMDRTATADRFEPVALKPSGRHAIRLDSLDVNMSTYMHASEAYNTPTGMNVGGHQHDNVSVYTIGTNMTGTTLMTTSTRTRRPGAARSRIEQEKRAQLVNGHKKGWHETMKAVSASTNRHWDPVRGWVDFEEDRNINSASLPDTPSGKIHLNLEKSIPHKKHESRTELVSQEANPVSIPFPEKWEKERRMMVEGAVAQSRGAAVTPDRRRARSASPGHSGWIESMKEASAALASEGKHWNPQTGWSDRSIGLHAANNDAMTLEGGRSQDDLDMRVASPPIEPKGNRAINANLQTDSNANSLPQKRETKVDDCVPTHELKQDLKNTDKSPAQSSAGAVPQVASEEQIGSNSSAQQNAPTPRFSPMSQATSPVFNLHSNVQEYEREAPAAPLSNSGSFPSIDMQTSPEIVSPVTTKVVKQKIGAEDFDLFPDDSAHLSQRREADHTTAFNQEDDNLNTSASRRSVNPIDIDEIVDPTWDEDDEDELIIPVRWEGKNRDPPGDSGDLGPIVASSSSSSRKIPKLRSSKRDTSPVSNRRSGNTASISSMSVLGSHISTRREAMRPDDHSRGQHTGVQVDSSFEQLLEVNDLEDARLFDPATASPDAIAREEHLVKQRLKQWESRAALVDRGTSENALASQEWKSFLGGKTANQREALLAHGVDVGSLSRSYDKNADPVGMQAQPTRADNSISDNLPERNIYRSRGGQESRTSFLDVSSVAKQEKISDFEQATSEYGPAPGEGNRSSFFKRFVECTAPIRAECHTMGANVQTSVNETMQEMRENDSMPMAHLAFLRSNAHAQGGHSKAGRFVPPTFCGRQDNVVVEDDNEDNDSDAKEEDHDVKASPPARMVASNHVRPMRPQSTPREAPRSRGIHSLGSTASSVVSADGFGAKTAYLEALALKGAVAGSKRSSSRPRGSRSTVSGVSGTSYASSAHSEKWKSFLEKKKLRSGVSPGRSIANESDVSRAAGRYASAKLEEMMSKNIQTKPGIRAMDSVENHMSLQPADELAAARVEAMMTTLTSTHHLDEAEI
ncbi:hypothetical protein MPSEU_000239800 [Mayamaea pseudoterrestris]|nr:hypothetical protein MPSEU_000239800 [Mayamaea pseudoterrestris]